MVVEGKTKFVRVKPPQEKTNSVADDIRPHGRHSVPGPSSVTIPPNMVHGSSEPISLSEILINNYRTRAEAQGHQIQRTGSRKFKSRRVCRSEQTRPVDIVVIDDDDDDDCIGSINTEDGIKLADEVDKPNNGNTPGIDMCIHILSDDENKPDGEKMISNGMVVGKKQRRSEPCPDTTHGARISYSPPSASNEDCNAHLPIKKRKHVLRGSRSNE